jgi:Zn-dependent protease with chaperone function
MANMFSITQEIQCYVTCITSSNLLLLIGLLLFLALLFFIFYLKVRKPITRIISFIAAQIIMLLVIFTTFISMKCSQMLTIEIYIAYAIISTTLVKLLPRMYYKILIKRYNAKPLTNIIDWPQAFVNTLTKKAKLYYYDSAIPRAFFSGKVIFLSMGMLELMDDLELKAVLAHEVWHLLHSNKMPVLRQLSFMTFTKNLLKDEFETLADNFAGEIVSRDAVESARAKLE